MRKIGSTRRAHCSLLPRFSASNCQLFIETAKIRYTPKVEFEFWTKLAVNSHLILPLFQLYDAPLCRLSLCQEIIGRTDGSKNFPEL